MRMLPRLVRMVCAAVGTFACVGVAHAQGFAAIVSPPRFELAMQPGERTRQVVEIVNAGAQAARYRVKTADWTIDAQAAVKFDDALAPDGCRPWVAIERREVAIAAQGRTRYRFEIAVPPQAPAGECRFALMVEGDEQTVQASGGLGFPVAGRIGVIVYVAIGDAKPMLEVVAAQVTRVNGAALPTLTIKNSGNAHGRLSGFLSGTDAEGHALEFTPSSLPILPGELRAIALAPDAGRDEMPRVAYPITIRGDLEWEGGKTHIEQRFAP